MSNESKPVRRFTLVSWLSIYGRDCFREFVKAEDYDALAKERADTWTALRAIEPFFREDMPDGPDGERGCATPEYRAAYRLLLASLREEPKP